MRFIGALFSFAVLIATTAVAVPSTTDRCGPDAQIIEKHVFATTASGAEIMQTVKTCPALSKRMPTTSTVHKRQVVQKDTSCPALECNTHASQPNIADCDDVLNSLDIANNSVLVQPGTSTTFESGNCEIIYVNQDTVVYQVFTAQMGEAIESAINTCTAMFSSPAAICLGSGQPNDDWRIDSLAR